MWKILCVLIVCNNPYICTHKLITIRPLYMKTSLFLFLTSIILFAGCGGNKEDSSKQKELNLMKEKIAQFAPVEIKYDHSILNERQKIVVQKLYEASKIIDKIFLTQGYENNRIIKDNLESSKDELDRLKLAYFNIMAGPFDRLDDNKPFAAETSKPLGANFYPSDMSKDEFDMWIKNNPDDEKAFTSEFTVIRRLDEKLTAIPYNDFYQPELTPAAQLLREAADFSDNPSLKKYLELRADAFLSNDYYKSDMAWMDLKDNDIEVVIGPYEVYEDELFNYKASFESFVTIKDPIESEKLAKFAFYLTDIERNLPIPENHKNYERGLESPIVVANEVFSGGDTKAGVQTLAFNLPNDERVRTAKGSKKVMLKNIHEAKFEKLLIPIAKIVMTDEQLKYVTFDGFFNHTLMHEMSHGVGPGVITLDGRKTEVKKELKETYSTLEECKADILGMYNNIFMIEKNVYEKSFEKEIWCTFLAGTFRSVRFGINEAHGSGNAIIYNYLIEKGGFEYDEKLQKVKVNYIKIYPALQELAKIVLLIQAEGDYNGSKKLIEKYVVNSPSLKTLREKLSSLPVDIKPVFQIENEFEENN